MTEYTLDKKDYKSVIRGGAIHLSGIALASLELLVASVVVTELDFAQLATEVHPLVAVVAVMLNSVLINVLRKLKKV